MRYKLESLIKLLPHQLMLDDLEILHRNYPNVHPVNTISLGIHDLLNVLPLVQYHQLYEILNFPRGIRE